MLEWLWRWSLGFKEFKKNTRKTIKELKSQQTSSKEDTPPEKEKPTQSKKAVLTRWSLSREEIITLMLNSEYLVMLQEYDLDTTSNETLLELFEKFKEWLNDQK